MFALEENTIMKATGIVRRIDDLGRVVIPKEIRRTLRIREGDPLEVAQWLQACHDAGIEVRVQINESAAP